MAGVEILRRGELSVPNAPPDKHQFIGEQGGRPCGKRHEFYLNDPSRTALEKLKTIFRQPVSQNASDAEPNAAADRGRSSVFCVMPHPRRPGC